MVVWYSTVLFDVIARTDLGEVQILSIRLRTIAPTHLLSGSPLFILVSCDIILDHKDMMTRCKAVTSDD